MLPVGHAVVKLQNRWRRPFLVRLPLVPVAKGHVSDQQLRELATFLEASKGNK